LFTNRRPYHRRSNRPFASDGLTERPTSDSRGVVAVQTEGRAAKWLRVPAMTHTKGSPCSIAIETRRAPGIRRRRPCRGSPHRGRTRVAERAAPDPGRGRARPSRHPTGPPGRRVRTVRPCRAADHGLHSRTAWPRRTVGARTGIDRAGGSGRVATRADPSPGREEDDDHDDPQRDQVRPVDRPDDRHRDRANARPRRRRCRPLGAASARSRSTSRPPPRSRAR